MPLQNAWEASEAEIAESFLVWFLAGREGFLSFFLFLSVHNLDQISQAK